MKKMNRYLYKVEDDDKKVAELRNWNDSEYTYIGNLSELAACKYLGIEWTTASKAPADLIDDDGMRFQVKSCKEGFDKSRFWLEQTNDRLFDRYIFAVVDEEARFVKIEADIIERIPHKNAHTWSPNGSGRKLEAIYRK